MQMLGYYAIRSKLSQGRFATVYRAFDTPNEREVALKVLPSQLSLDLVFVERFQAEMGRLSTLRHPQLAAIYATSQVASRLVIATELVHGPSLAQAIARRGFIPWAEGLALLQAVCQALDYLHGQGIAHQDLKPADILLDEKRGALLTDFGWAQLVWQSNVGMSLGGGIMSTPLYAAPEVWESNVARPPADIYALGCVLYEMLSGRVLFAGKTPLQVELAHERGVPFPDTWRTDAPDGLETVLRQALAYRPADRYPSAGAFWQALDNLRATATPARPQAQAPVQLVAGERARREAEEGAKQEEEHERREAEEREAEKRAKQEEERERREAEERAQRAAEERVRQEEKRTQRQAEERARQEAEARAKQEAAKRAKLEAEERAKQEAAARAQFIIEKRAKRQAEERARRMAEERPQGQALPPRPGGRVAPPAAPPRQRRRSARWVWIGLAVFMGLCILCPMAFLANLPSGPSPTPTRTRASLLPTATRKGVTSPIAVPTLKVANPIPVPTLPPPRRVPGNTLRANLDGGLSSLDPHLASSDNSQAIAAEVFVGLTRLDEETSQVQPGLASQWSISEDGKKYTFHLRQNVPWVRWDGEQVSKVKDCDGQDRLVTARDFEYGLKRVLDPDLDVDDASILARFIAGGEDLYSGRTSDAATLGVRAIDEWTLEITFTQEAVYNPSALGLWLAVAVPQWVIEGDGCTEARGDDWAEPDSFQSYGPFALKEWQPDSHLTLVRNLFWPSSSAVPQARLNEISFTLLSSADALDKFKAGELDLASVPVAKLAGLKADPAWSKLVKVVPRMCSSYYGFNTAADHVSDVRVRRALSLAVDREKLVKDVLAGEMEPARWYTRPGLAAAPTLERYPELGAWYDPDEAARLLDDYLAEKGLTAQDLDITLMFSTSSGHRKGAETIQQMWKDGLGLDVTLAEEESNRFMQAVKSQDAPQIWRLAWCMDYPDASALIDAFALGNPQNNPAKDGQPAGGAHWKNERFSELIGQAARERDLAKRTEFYAQAEQLLCYEDAVIAPLYWYTRLTVTQPWVERTFSLSGREQYEKWWLRP
ncbi:MAG: protein kinase [Thermoflexales bacterium]|nr:protein kinase [Thermoflexales bacterium]